MTARALGGWREPSGAVAVLALLEPGGTLRVIVGERATGIGSWRAAGTGRVVAVAEWFVAAPDGLRHQRVSVRAAAELSHDGRRAEVRVQWQPLDAEGVALSPAAPAEAHAERLEP